MDLSALAGVTPDQVALIAHLLQSGQLKVDNGVPAPNAAEVPISDPPKSSVPEQLQRKETGNTDKEDGELEEGEVGESDRSERGFLRPPPSGPRSLQQLPRDTNGHPRGNLSPDQLSTSNRPSSRGLPVTTSLRPKAPSPKPSKSAEAKAFVLQLHASGYNFDDVARQLGDTASLRRMFQELELPLEGPKLYVAPRPAQTSATPPQTMSNEARKRPSAPPKAASTDRNEYLARLAAAKNKSIPAAPAVPSPPVAPAQGVAKPATLGPAAVIAEAETEATKSSPVAKLTYRRELVKQRMEALMAERAANKAARERAGALPAAIDTSIEQSGPPTPIQNVPSPSQAQQPGADGLGAGLAHAGFLSNLQTTLTTQNATPVRTPATSSPLQGGVSLRNEAGNSTSLSARPFGYLPGLFMTPNIPVQPLAVQNTSTSTPTVQSAITTGGRKRPLSQSSGSGETSPNSVKRPFGTSRHQSPERVAIQVSEDDYDDDDDDEGEDMEIDTNGLSPSSGSADASQRALDSDAPTPADGPSQYQQKLEEIEEIKRRIAEKERAKLNGKVAVAGDVQEGSTPEIKDAVAEPSEDYLGGARVAPRAPSAPLDSIQHSIVPSAPTDRPMSAAAVARQQEKVRLQSRLHELQSSMQQHGNGHSGTVVRNEGMDAESSPIAFDLPNGQQTFVNGVALLQTSPSFGAVQDRRVRGDSQAGLDNQSDENGAQITPDPLENDMSDGEVEMSDGDGDVDSDGENVENPSGLSHSSSVDHTADVAEIVQDAQGATTSPESETDDDEVDDDASDDEMDESDGPDDDSDYGQNALPEPAQDGYEDTDEGEFQPEGQVDDQTFEEREDLAPADQEALMDGGGANMGNVSDAHSPRRLPPAISTKQPQANGYYTPYQSPLTRFQDYKFHYDYLSKVPSGYNSLTYNHKVDPTKFICPYEATGGRCNDKHCEHQHFHSLGLSDDDLLKSLVSRLPPNCAVEDYPRWREGLGALIRELRSASLSHDAATIAAKIAQYRREFTGDATKTINLDHSS